MDRTGHSLSQLFVVAASMMVLAGSLGVETGVVLLSIGIDLGIGYDIVGTISAMISWGRWYRSVSSAA